jgi:hypothetical protein
MSCVTKLTLQSDVVVLMPRLGKTHSSKFPNAKCPFVLGSKVFMD